MMGAEQEKLLNTVGKGSVKRYDVFTEKKPSFHLSPTVGELHLSVLIDEENPANNCNGSPATNDNQALTKCLKK